MQADPNGYDIAFIEFDQRGDFWDRGQLATARTQLRKRIAKGKKPLLVEYVHGWHHNSQEDAGRDVEGFRKLLTYLAKSEYLTEKLNYQVFGVYIGWRGEKYRSGKDPIGRAFWLPSQLSFYPIKQIGSEVSSMPMISEAIFWMVHEARANPNGSRTVLIGHSFGAMVLENAIAQAVASSTALMVGDGGKVPPPADLTLLLNSAASSLRAKGVAEMFSRMGRSAAARYTDPERPLMVSVTSTNDKATKVAYPIGTGLSNLAKRFRSYDKLGPSGEKQHLNPPVSQRYFVTHTPGHNKLLLTHKVCASQAIEPTSRKIASDGPGQAVFEQNLQQIVRSKAGDGELARWRFKSISKNRGSCDSWIESIPAARLRTGYWVVQAPKEVIYNHGDIFNEQALCLYAALFRIANPIRQ